MPPFVSHATHPPGSWPKFVSHADAADAGAFKPTVVPGTDVPLLVFVNARSGGGKGQIVLNWFKAWLPESQICNLSLVGKGGPSPQAVLKRFVYVPKTRVLMCGGDGTCSWLLTAIDEVCKFAGVASGATLSAAVMPLGTGNDLSRALGFGHGFTGAMVKPAWALKVAQAAETQLDRWSVTIAAASTPEGLPMGYVPLPSEDESLVRHRGLMYNYFSMGAEAAGLHGFHVAREANPAEFNSRLKNQVKMIQYGAKNVGIGAPCCNKPYVPVSERTRLHVIDRGATTWREVELPPHLVSILVVNIRSHAAGRHVWEPVRKPWGAQSAGDGLVEIAAMQSLAHAGCYLMCGFGRFGACSGVKLAQAAALKFELLEPVHVQIDGEPWLQPTGTITIELAGKSAVLSPLKGRAAPPQSSTRVVPSGSSAATAPQASRLPPEWKESYDPVAQHEYWENSKTGETRWNRPC